MRTFGGIKRSLITIALGGSMLSGGCGLGLGGLWGDAARRAAGTGYITGIEDEFYGLTVTAIPFYELTQILWNGPITEAAETAVGEDAADGAEAIDLDHTGA